MGLEGMQVGATARQSVVCGPEHFASRIVAGTPDVFSTPSLGALVEKTAAEWMAGHLEPGQMTVGAQIVINHTGATPEGLTVTAEVRLVAVDGRRFDFEWTAHDGVEQVGYGTHQRFVVDRARFEGRVAGKRGGAGSSGA
ncbi:thioesterase family protein [Tepidiforma sp.]|uniref:thioesterase family protein n=1 Tax=Tepidiforma sp. TaxID=2682230 RepID=UPI002ADD54F2|nr:hotdog domain-containing protein [Tepidiforma sp.]